MKRVTHYHQCANCGRKNPTPRTFCLKCHRTLPVRFHPQQSKPHGTSVKVQPRRKHRNVIEAEARRDRDQEVANQVAECAANAARMWLLSRRQGEKAADGFAEWWEFARRDLPDLVVGISYAASRKAWMANSTATVRRKLRAELRRAMRQAEQEGAA